MQFNLEVIGQLEKALRQINPLVLIVFSILLAQFVTYIFKNFYKVKVKTISLFFYFLRKTFFYKKIVNNKMQKILANMEQDFFSISRNMSFLENIPIEGKAEEEIFEIATREIQLLGEGKWKDGWCSGTVYSSNDSLPSFFGKIFEIFCLHNPLHHDVFPSTQKMEAECVRMISNLFNGGPEAIGCITTSGSESNILACKTYRDRAIKKGSSTPTMLIPVSAHCSFDKAAHLLGIKLIKIDLVKDSMKVDIAQMEEYIDHNTCMLVGSSPNYPHGIVDPIDEISALGIKYSIPVHVDCCLGGFLIAFAGDEVLSKLPLFDFRNAGVTSISCDPHKYGSTPKGISSIIYRHRDYMEDQYFVFPEWQGGFYCTVAFAGTRCGALIATCWATFLRLGKQFYIEQCDKIIKTADIIKESVGEIKEIDIIGDPHLSIIAFTSKSLSIFAIGDILAEKGWHLNFLQHPVSFHICLTNHHTKEGVATRFIQDVGLAVNLVRADRSGSSNGECSKIYGTLASVPDIVLKSDFGGKFLNMTLSTDRNYYSNN